MSLPLELVLPILLLLLLLLILLLLVLLADERWLFGKTFVSIGAVDEPCNEAVLVFATVDSTELPPYSAASELLKR